MTWSRSLFYYIASLALWAIPAQVWGVSAFGGTPLEQWISFEAPTALKGLLRNISVPGTAKGAVVASPSQSSPNYFYHWVRDAAVVMDEIVFRYEASEPSKSRGQYLDVLLDYLQFSRVNQETPNLSGGLGEPKFHVDGSAYNESWGRPQDDGPALRAITLTHLARVWIKQGKESWVREKLYNGFNSSIIKKDLEYVASHWRKTSFELWEEVKGHHFHTRMVQYRALREGAELAMVLHDDKAAHWYSTQASELESELSRHWNPAKKILVSTLDRDDGLDYKFSELDSSVVLGVLHGNTSQGFMSFSDDRVLATVKALEDIFYQIYPINQNGEPGIAIGRYPEDRYDGYSSGGSGNPWFIGTSAFAEFYYRLAKELEKRSEIKINSTNRSFFWDLKAFKEHHPVYKKGSDSFKEIVRLVRAKGDAFLTRVKYHVDGTGSMSEQINRQSGYMQGARDLTWSYAAFLSAIRYR